jgi:isocitrate/isopropylmalate dehydrogenase
MKSVRKVSKNFPEVYTDDFHIDAAAAELIKRPENFDVILTTNLFGDILSDEAAQIVGGLGLVPSGNIGDHFALFEPVHGSAPDIAGRNIANPISLILSAAMMLEWLGREKKDAQASEASRKIHTAVEHSLRSSRVTPDLGGNLSTVEMGNAIAGYIS